MTYSAKPFGRSLSNYLDYGHLMRTKNDRLHLFIRVSIILVIFVITKTLIVNNQRVGFINQISFYTATICNICFIILLHLFEISFKQDKTILAQTDNTLIKEGFTSKLVYENFAPIPTLQIDNNCQQMNKIDVESIKADEVILNSLAFFFKEANVFKKILNKLREDGFINEDFKFIKKNKTHFSMLLVYLEDMNLLNDLENDLANFARCAESVFGIKLKSKSHYYNCRSRYLDNYSSRGQKKILEYFEITLKNI